MAVYECEEQRVDRSIFWISSKVDVVVDEVVERSVSWS